MIRFGSMRKRRGAFQHQTPVPQPAETGAHGRYLIIQVSAVSKITVLIMKLERGLYSFAFRFVIADNRTRNQNG
jgi:hypothetical protein